MTNPLFGNIDHVTAAEGGIFALRRLLVSLALNGRFTQASSAEAAGLRTSLLQLDALKKAYIESGKVSRKAVGLNDGAQASQCLCPEGWGSVFARDVFLPRSGNSKLIKGKLFPEAASNLFPGFSASGQDVWLESFEHEGSAVIVSAVGARCGKAFLATGRWSAIANTHIIWPVVELVMPEFAMLWLNDEAFWLRSGGAQPFIKVADTLSRTLPLPPMEEQMRIVAKVDELMALCDRLEADQADAEAAHSQLVQALLDSLIQTTDAADFRASWQRLSEHFHTLFTTEASIDALKQTVLQLAVMGKLVPQTADDEHASTLLQRAEAEKKRMVAEGRVRKDRSTSSNAKGDLSFAVPPGWAWAKKSDVLNFLNGYAFKSEWFRPNGVRLLRNINVGHGALDWHDTACIPDEMADDFAAFSLCAGDLVLTLDRPIISTGLKVAVLSHDDLPCLLLQRVAKLSSYADVVSKGYLLIWLNSAFFIDAIDPGRSNGVPHISTTQVGAMSIALPPLAEQHRIVAKVDELMALCDQLKAQLAEARHQHAQLATVLVEQAVA